MCAAHYRGQSLCGVACKEASRCASRRKYQRSPEGAEDHKERNRDYRRRFRRRVMELGSTKLPAETDSCPRAASSESTEASLLRAAGRTLHEAQSVQVEGDGRGFDAPAGDIVVVPTGGSVAATRAEPDAGLPPPEAEKPDVEPQATHGERDGDVLAGCSDAATRARCCIVCGRLGDWFGDPPARKSPPRVERRTRVPRPPRTGRAPLRRLGLE